MFVQYNSSDSSVTHIRSFLLLHSTGAVLGGLLGGLAQPRAADWTVACERLTSEISGLYPEIRSTTPSTPRGRDPRRDLQAVAYPPRSATAAEFLRTGPNLCVGQIFISPGSTSFRMSHLDHHNGRVLWRTNLTQQCGTRSNTSPASTQTPPFLFLAFAFS